MTIKIIGPLSGGKIREGDGIINTTSRSSGWSRGLSPFFIGPVKLYSVAPCKEALKVENAWQYSKVYKQHDNGWPTSFYFDWAKKGFENSIAVRYPMGKGAVPEYFYWNEEKLTYIEARRKIYIPLYKEAVSKTEAYKELKRIYKSRGEITLFCYDGYDHREFGFSWEDVINHPKLSMGHGFVLAMMLEDYL